MLTPDEYLAFAVRLAKKAGVVMRQNFSLAMTLEWKSTTSPVTATDKEINEAVKRAVRATFPTHGFIGEEGGTAGDERYVWICDPVDGTIPFAHGIPTCAFMLALCERGRPLVGVIYDPFQERMFTAMKGRGTQLNGKPVHVSNHKAFKRAVFGLFWWGEAPYDLSPLIVDLNREGCVDASMGSIGYADMLVASGMFAFVIFAGKHPWDSAAPDLIVTEAGGRFTDLCGKAIDYRRPVRGHVASNGKLHKQVLERVRKIAKIT